METIKDFRNDLLKRKELKVIVESASNPGLSHARKIIADGFKAKEECVVVKELKSKFGRNTFLIDAFIYDSVDSLNKIEPKPKAKKAESGDKK